MIAPCNPPNVLVRYPSGLPGCLRPCAFRPGGCGPSVQLNGLECGCSAPTALEGCGCKYGGASMRGLEGLDAGAIDMAWHTSAVLGSVAGAIAVWWFKRRKR